MPALRLMTFNVQMLPLGAMLLTGKTNNAEERADTVAQAILSLPADEQPDVIVFNEVFDEDGRKRLVDRLTGYPNRMQKMDSTFYLEDSGLMLFSKHELVVMPCGKRTLEYIYDASAGDDSQAAKGVCVVQINQPTDAVTIAFTHLQASYNSDNEHADVREAQLLSVIGTIAEALNENHSERWRNVIFVGDLNIRSDRGSSTNEWSAVFENGPLGAIFADGWHQWMASPQGSRKDDGLTNIDFEDGVMRRLDYQCFRHPTTPPTSCRITCR
ncbi:MAG: endonuclease/exonuclease/phosphatase family protein [Hyphomicrobiales bacterium]